MSNMLPLVSVCVITYNQSRYIRQCLDSILNQVVDFNIEICIGEDASSDGTREIFQEYARRYPNIIRLFLRDRKDVIQIDGNPTGTYNFFETLRSCRGDYIAICEGDDYWIDVFKLKKQLEALLKSSQSTICYSNVSVVYEDGRMSHPAYAARRDKRKIRHNRIGIIEKPSRNLTIKDLALRNCIHTPGVFFRNWIRDYDLPAYVWKCGLGDWALHMAGARFGSLVFVDEELAAYRVHPGGVWSHVDELKKMKTVVGASLAMVNAGVFSSEVELVLKEKVLKVYKRAWRRAAKNSEPQIVASLLCQLAQEAPNLMPYVVKRLNRKRFFW